MGGFQSSEGEILLGRMEFIRSVCLQKGWGFELTVQRVLAEALRLAGTADRQMLLHQTLFARSAPPASPVPGWMDKLWLEAICRVLSAPSATLWSRTSLTPCVAFEAGRHSALRQGESLPKNGLHERSPQSWLRTGFCAAYRSRYGPEAASRLRVERLSRAACRISMDHRDLEKAGPLDCTTILGFLHGFMERLGARDLVVTHDACCTDTARKDERCVFTLEWSAGPLVEELGEAHAWERTLQ